MGKFKLLMVLVMAAFVLTLTGCAIMDGFFGIEQPPGPDGQVPPPMLPAPGTPGSPFDLVGLIPGVAGLLGAARWIYTEIRARRLDGSFKAAVAGVSAAVDGAKGQPLDKDTLYRALTAASEIYANRDFFVNTVQKIKDEVRKPKN